MKSVPMALIMTFGRPIGSEIKVNVRNNKV